MVSVDWNGDAITDESWNSLTKTITYSHTFTTPGDYTVGVTVTDRDSTPIADTFKVHVDPLTLRVTDFTATASGFDLQFNMPADINAINLYQGALMTLGAADVSMVGNVVGTVFGSLVWDATTNTAHFVKTGGILEGDTYRVTLFSRNDGWVDELGNLLDGDSDGINGGNYETSMTVASSESRVLSLPDFARGPTQLLDVADNGTAIDSGLTVSIDEGWNVEHADFVLHFDPALMIVNSVALAPGMPTDWTINYYEPVSGELHVTVYSTTATTLPQALRDWC